MKHARWKTKNRGKLRARVVKRIFDLCKALLSKGDKVGFTLSGVFSTSDS